MLSSVLARIKSAPKAVLTAIVLTVAVFVVALVMLWPSGGAKAAVNGYSYSLEIADTDALRRQGLGGRDSMSASTGMLFVFDQPGEQCFWMKDMRFSLDIIWLDAQHKVVHMQHNVSPSTYPNSFCPPQPAQYVLELRAGQAKRAGIQQGSLVDF